MSDLTLPRRVLMTTDAVGGIWTYAVELATGLASRGVEVLLAVMGPEPSPAQRAAVDGVAGIEIVLTGQGLEWLDRRGSDVPEAKRVLFGIARRWHPDLVHVNGFREATFGWDVPVLLAAHSCVTTWWRAVHGTMPPREWGRYIMAVQAGLAAADVIVAPSRGFRYQLEAAYGAQTKARVILNGRDLPPGPEGDRQEVILTAGRLWDEAKNVSTLAEAGLRLPWPVLVAGPQADARRLPGVTTLGELDARALRTRMETAEIYASPARYEPFGLAVLEAAAAGCALVLSDIMTFRELWKDAALFAPPGDSRRLQAAIQSLIDEPWQRRRLQAVARERALHLTRERMVDSYAALYGELMAHRVPARARTVAA